MLSLDHLPNSNGLVDATQQMVLHLSLLLQIGLQVKVLLSLGNQSTKTKRSEGFLNLVLLAKVGVSRTGEAVLLLDRS
jgi:hypothetical protein